MLGITDIGIALGENKISNYARKGKFDINDDFIEQKIGFQNLCTTKNGTTKLCLKAYEHLSSKREIKDIECLLLVSQNQDIRIPHTSALLHKELGFSKDCLCFDIALGCSGYVIALANILSLMKSYDIQNSLLFTCDPYRKIINENDKNTSLLFGDAASASFISKDCLYSALGFKFGIMSEACEAIFCEKDSLQMDGRAVFNFAATTIPKHIEAFLQEFNLSKDEVDKFLFHQGSKYIVDTLAKRLGLEPRKFDFLAQNYGNVVSSSLPLMLESLWEEKMDKILMCGFGTGGSYASSILTKEMQNAN